MKTTTYLTTSVRGVLLALTLGLSLTAPAWAAQPDPDRYIVSFLDAGKGKAALQAAGGRIVLDLPQHEIAAAHIPARALKGLRNNPNIEYIERDMLRHPMAQVTPWGVDVVLGDGVPGAAPSERTICIIDSGYDGLHEDLPAGNNVDGTNVTGSGNWYEDSCNHGTHVAGTIAALNNDRGVVGVTDGSVGLHIIKVFDGENCGWAYSSSLVAALDECITAGANVVSMSLGGAFKSRSEDRAFRQAANGGVLSIAAAGNDGTTRKSYPASYDSVMSVAAVDSAGSVASFSQQNDQVEIAAPGVAVRSTVPMGEGTDESLVVDGTSYEAVAMEDSPDGSVSASLHTCAGVGGLGDCTDATGAVCLISRGDISFADKVLECERAGGVAAVIYNNAPALFSGTLGGVATTIPSVGISGVDGTALAASGGSATVTVGPGNYAFFDGTSMATPHVSAVAALVWSTDTACSNDDVRNALTASAFDLPPDAPDGRDNATGFGLVQADAAAGKLADFCGGGGGDTGGGDTGGGGGSCAPKGTTCSSDSECCSGACKGKPGSESCK